LVFPQQVPQAVGRKDLRIAVPPGRSRLDFYNRERAHQGYRTQGRTPYQAFVAGIEAMRREEMKPEAA